MKYLRPRLPEKEIELCLDLFDKQEAKKRILKYIEGVLDDAESQFKNCFTHDVGVSLLEFIEDVKHMMDLYGASRYTQAERIRDELAEKLDDIMRFSNER